MGYCCNNRCFNTPHMWQQGWLAAAEYDHTSLGVGKTITLSLAAQVRVLAGWLALHPLPSRTARAGVCSRAAAGREVLYSM